MKDHLIRSTAVFRGTVVRANDKTKLQGLTVRGRPGESYSDVEHFHPFGFTSVPLPPASEQDKQTAEVLMAYVGGDPAHPVVLATSDRRHRPTNLKPGESALHDGTGQMVHVSEKGIRLDAGQNKKPIPITVGDATFTVADGKITAKVGSMTLIVSANRIDIGGEGGSPVMTQAGPSTKVFAVR